MIDLYYAPTPNGWKISIMLEECEMDYRVIPVNLGKGDQFTPEFLKISPNNRMPVIVDHENLIDGERGLPGYSKSNIYNIRWSHSQDSKANPYNRFSASVNLGSSNYFRESLNQINTPNFLNNTLNSSVSLSGLTTVFISRLYFIAKSKSR